MAQTRFTCTLTTADEPACQSYARVTITDSEGATALTWTTGGGEPPGH
jgi:hypothetical protein